MKGKIITVILISLSWTVSSFSQCRISTKPEALKYNAAVLSRAVIDVFGEDSVSCWLERNEPKFLCLARVDKYGELLCVEKVRIQRNGTHSFMDEWRKPLEQVLRRNGAKFIIAIDNYHINIPIEEYQKIYSQEDSIPIFSAAFPGTLMWSYSWDGGGVSRIEYLKLQIAYWLKQDNNIVETGEAVRNSLLSAKRRHNCQSRDSLTEKL